MVRQMKCPFCGNSVNVSSHWQEATCPSCRQSFEIGVEVFELSEEEQEQEARLAEQKMKEEEQKRRERVMETKKRLRKMLHLPEPDPHAGIRFEEDGAGTDNGKQGSVDTDTERKKKAVIFISAAAVFLLLLIIVFAVMVSRVLKGSGQGVSASADGTVESVQVADAGSTYPVVDPEPDASVEKHDGSWTDGFSLDSNTGDGKHMIDVQDSQSGEQREPVMDDDSRPEMQTGDTVSENTVQEPDPATAENSSSSSAVMKEAGNAVMTQGQSGVMDKEILNMLLNGAE